MLKQIKFSIIISILFYIFIFFFLLKNSFGYLDPDFGWHLKVGESIIQENSVPHINYYNYTLKETKWVDHEWLMDATTFWIYDNFGYLVVNIFFALIILVLLIILHIFVVKNILKKNNLILIILFYILGLLAMQPHLGARMQEITLLNLLLLIIILYYYTKNKKIQLLFCLPILFYFWACVHAGFLIGIFILFFFTLIKLAELKLSKYKNKLSFINFSGILNFKQIIIFLLFAFISVAATFLTPYKSELYSFLTGYKNNFYLTHINEWLPQYYFPFQYWQLIYLAIVASIIILLIIDSRSRFTQCKDTECPIGHSVSKIKIKQCKDTECPIGHSVSKMSKIKINIWDITISLFFIFLSFKSKRHFPLLFVVSFPMVIDFFKTQTNSNSNNLKNLIATKMIPVYLSLCLIMLTANMIITTKFTLNPFNSFCDRYPCKAIEFLKQNQQYDNFNIFNNYSWGGYLIWTLPERKLFIDGRLPQYEFAKHTMLEEYFEFYDKEKIENKLKQRNIGLVLLDIKIEKYKFNWFEKYFLDLNENKINKSAKKNDLKDYLDNSKKWKMVYNDNVSNIYVKK